MQITFDTSNPKDLALLDKILSLSTGEKSQPEVEQNTGTTATGLPTLSPEGSGVSGAVAEAAAPAPEKKARAKKTAAPVEQQAEAPASTEDAPSKTDTDDTKPLTLDEVRAALQSFTAANGVPAGIELLKKYNAARISELAEENFAAFVAECK